MNKEIKDYLHFYLGCDVEHDKGIYRGTLIGIDSSCAKIHCDFFQRDKGHRVPKGKDFGYFDILQERMKPILRPLSDMTEEEKQWVKLTWEAPFAAFDREPDIRIFDYDSMHQARVPSMLACAEVTLYLLSKHFDLFGLIEAGLAIDKTKLHSQTLSP